MAEDWNARADREAAAIVAEVGGRFPDDPFSVYGNRQAIVALAWLHGYKAGMRETLDEAQASLRAKALEILEQWTL